MRDIVKVYQLKFGEYITNEGMIPSLQTVDKCYENTLTIEKKISEEYSVFDVCEECYQMLSKDDIVETQMIVKIKEKYRKVSIGDILEWRGNKYIIREYGYLNLDTLEVIKQRGETQILKEYLLCPLSDEELEYQDSGYPMIPTPISGQSMISATFPPMGHPFGMETNPESIQAQISKNELEKIDVFIEYKMVENCFNILIQGHDTKKVSVSYFVKNETGEKKRVVRIQIQHNLLNSSVKIKKNCDINISSENRTISTGYSGIELLDKQMKEQETTIEMQVHEDCRVTVSC